MDWALIHFAVANCWWTWRTVGFLKGISIPGKLGGLLILQVETIRHFTARVYFHSIISEETKSSKPRSQKSEKHEEGESFSGESIVRMFGTYHIGTRSPKTEVRHCNHLCWYP